MFQPIGKNTIGKVPQKIATYLQLPDAEGYTGHCFRKTAVTLAAEAGLGDQAMCNAAGWNNIQTSKRYTANTVSMKKKTAKLMSKRYKESIFCYLTKCDTYSYNSMFTFLYRFKF